jgi:hypothetical protein
MKAAPTRSLLLAVAWGFVAAAAPAREETIAISPTRTITVNVPDGFTYRAGIDANGALAVTLLDARERVSLQVVFAPDGEGLFKSERARKELMHERFAAYVEGSVEKAMRFEELAPRIGAGTFCVFTDAKLAGRAPAEYPAGEYLHLTVGAKAWPGAVATFTLFSQDTESAVYRAALGALRESIHEKPAPLL